eukprot:365409-Chlamydomonas_euryale.AAC.5
MWPHAIAIVWHEGCGACRSMQHGDACGHHRVARRVAERVEACSLPRGDMCAVRCTWDASMCCGMRAAAHCSSCPCAARRAQLAAAHTPVRQVNIDVRAVQLAWRQGSPHVAHMRCRVPSNRGAHTWHARKNLAATVAGRLCAMQAGLLMANGVAVLNNERFLEKRGCNGMHASVVW